LGAFIALPEQSCTASGHRKLGIPKDVQLDFFGEGAENISSWEPPIFGLVFISTSIQMNSSAKALERTVCVLWREQNGVTRQGPFAE